MSIEIFHSSRAKKELKVVFVSDRDSCRAPISDSIFQHLADKYADQPWNKFYWRSASCGSRVPPSMQGKSPDNKTIRVLIENHLETTHACRSFKMFDFARHDYIICFEPSQLNELNTMAPEGKKAKIHMLGEFITGREKIIEDPIFDDMNAFRICFERLYIACENFYFHIHEKRLC